MVAPKNARSSWTYRRWGSTWFHCSPCIKRYAVPPRCDMGVGAGPASVGWAEGAPSDADGAAEGAGSQAPIAKPAASAAAAIRPDLRSVMATGSHLAWSAEILRVRVGPVPSSPDAGRE